MANITIINDDGQQVEREVVSREVTVIPEDGPTFDPAVAQNIEFDHRGIMSSITSVCGETENRRMGNNLPQVTIEGVLTESQLPEAKNLRRGENITLVSDVYQGEVIVNRMMIEQTTDLLTYQSQGGEEELAFSFQLQLKEPGTEELN